MKKLLLLFISFLFALNIFAQCEPGGVYSAIVEMSPTPKGALKGLFSVSDKNKVFFSQGNLQYNAKLDNHACNDGTTKAGTWRFAEQQYNYVGSDNTKVSVNYNGWIDLFSWGTSGWNSGATYYQPYSVYYQNEGFYLGGDYRNHMTANEYASELDCSNADWGIYNAISNGGNQPNQWRVLTNDEWNYLLTTRSSKLKAFATVNGVTGMILLPDDWEWTGVGNIPSSWVYQNSKYNSNIYTGDTWVAMNNAGAVFLPNSGSRSTNYSTTTVFDAANCIYWTSNSAYTESSSTSAFAFYLHNNGKESGTMSRWSRYWSACVRLVKQNVAKNGINMLYSYITSASQGTINVVETNGNYIVTAIPASGYTFYKWLDNNSTNPSRNVCCLSELTTYTAQFVAGYTVTFRDGVQDSLASVYSGCSIAMPTRFKEGFVFAGWTSVNGGKVSNIAFPYTPTADIVLYPVFHKTTINSPINTSALEIDASDASNWDITIANGGVLTVTETTAGSQFNFRSITIKAGGRLVIPSGTYLSTSKLVMEGGDVDASDNYIFNYPQLVANGTLNVSGNVIYYDCLLNKKQQYPLCLPVNVSVANVTYADGSAAVLGTNYKIATYNGAARAIGELGWEYIPNNTVTLTAGKGYTIFANPQYYQYGGTGSVMQYKYSRLRFPLPISANYTEAAKTVSVSPYLSATGKDNDAGWNFVGNPYFADFSQNALGLSYQASDRISLLTLNSSGGFDWAGNQRYIVFISDDGKSYYSELASAADLSTFRPFFVQIGANDAAALSFPISSRKQNMLSKNVEDADLMTGIILSQSANAANFDRLGVLIGDSYTDAYEINADLQKFGHNSGVNLYAWMRSSELAFVAVNESYAANAIPVGFIAPQAGEYTFALDSRYDSSPFSAVVLYDSETRQSTDLLASDYKFSVSKAQTNNARFTLSLIVRADMPTAIGGAKVEQGQVVKSLVNGNLILRVNGQEYNAQGAILK